MRRGQFCRITLGCALATLLAQLAQPSPVAARTRARSQEVLVGKRCSACRRRVSLKSSPGQRCPYCGAYWSFETREAAHSGRSTRNRRHRQHSRHSRTARRAAAPGPAPRPGVPSRLRLFQSPEARNIWRQAILAQAAARNPAVRPMLNGGVPEPVRIAESPPVVVPAAASRAADPLRDADAVLRASRGAPVRARMLALWIVRHPEVGRSAIPTIYGSGQALHDLLRESRTLLIQAGLTPESYGVFRL